MKNTENQTDNNPLHESPRSTYNGLDKQEWLTENADDYEQD